MLADEESSGLTQPMEGLLMAPVPDGGVKLGLERPADDVGTVFGWKLGLNWLIEQHILQSAEIILAGVAAGHLEKPRHVFELVTSDPSSFLSSLSMLGSQPVETDPWRSLALTRLEGPATTRVGI